jgi:KDO2-lipid IV(A) lauroyltransferase
MYRAYALPPIRVEEGEHAEKNVTQAIARVLEGEIRKNPEQWLWVYKRWKYIPAEATSVERYPFYARFYQEGKS